MKTQKEIEALAKTSCNMPINLVIDEEERYYRNFEKFDGFVEGYTQCQEDMKSLLLEIKDSWKGDKLLGGTYEKICNSLNKQN
jgi:hypothetical protein